VAADLDYTPTNTYNNTPQGANVRLASGLSGAGTIKVTYDSVTTVPTDAGEWDLVATVADGSNFIGDSINLGKYRILQVVPTKEMFTFGKITDIPWTGEPAGIGEVKFAGVGSGYGDLTVLYNGAEEAPVDSGSVVNVTLIVGGGKNYTSAVIDLGTYTIRGKDYVGVLAGNREIPNSVTVEQVAVAPVKVSASQVTAGPSPVSSNGTVNIFWNGSKSVKGKLAVFSATGAKVATLNVSGTGKIGSWSVKGVAEGTYLVKGVVKSASGEKVKVSTVVAVAK